MDLELVLGIIWGIVVWFLLGGISAIGLVGDYTFSYPGECFGPLNVYKHKRREAYSEENNKRNCKRKFYLYLGGAFSFVFMILVFLNI